MCKRHRFGYWSSCKRLPSFVNVAALATSKAPDQPAHLRSVIRAFASRLNIL